MQITKKERRQRRAIKTRMKIRELGVARLTVHRTPQHIYAQVFDASGGKVLATASTVQEKVAKGLKGTGNVEAAKAVGTAIAEAAKAAGGPIALKGFVRFAVGEGVEKKVDDFAAEVASMTGKS